MSFGSMQCCCDIETPVCENTCRCASSYSVDSLQGSYSYTNELDHGSFWNCSSCPGYACYETWHEITVNWELVDPMTLTEVSIPGSLPAACCYKGTGTVRVYGSIKITERYRCGPTGESGCPDWEEVHDIPFDKQTCVCLTVKCGTVPDCLGLHAGAGWIHQVEIGDFIATCSIELRGGYADCERCYDDPPPGFGPISIRVHGGVVAYKTPLSKCHDGLLASDWSCLGFRRYLDNCPTQDPDFPENNCFNNMPLSYVFVGPFGLTPAGECSEGQDDTPCVDPLVTAPWFYNNILPHPSALPADQVQPVCGFFSNQIFLCNGTIRQDIGQGSCQQAGAPIVYS